MNILDTIKDFFKKKAAKTFSNKVAKDLLPKITEKVTANLLPKFKEQIAGAGGQITDAVEEAIKDELKGIATDMVNEQIDQRAKIPENMQHLKDQITEAAVEALVDMAYDSVKDAILGQ